MTQRVAHFDLDSFFVAVERLENPSLIGKPILVGWLGPRGVVTSASYEARQFGCRSAQPMEVALKLCPSAMSVEPRIDLYRQVSDTFHKKLREYSSVVESVSIDEAFVDFSELQSSEKELQVIETIRRAIKTEIGLVVSAGLANSKTAAKIGSALAKPDGLIVVPPDDDAVFMKDLAIKKLPSVGPALEKSLREIGFETIGDVANSDKRFLRMRFGRIGESIFDKARGLDFAKVESRRRERKSISRETTFPQDVSDVSVLSSKLQILSEAISSDISRESRSARTIGIKIRWADFVINNRQTSVTIPVTSSSDIYKIAERLLTDELRDNPRRPIRLIGISLSSFGHITYQPSLDSTHELDIEMANRGKREQLDHTISEVRDRFGSKAVIRGLDNT